MGSIQKECSAKADSNVSDACVLQRLGTFDRHSQAKLIDDLRVGETFMSDRRVASVLDRCYGVKSDFLGTGLSLPDTAGSDYASARLPEYWIANRVDSDATVWTWILEPDSATMNEPLLRVLESRAPVGKSNHRRSFRSEVQLNAAHLVPGDKAPVLIRFAQFPKNQYQGSIGRPGSDLIFVNHFGELAKLDLSVAESASYSGRSIQSSRFGKEIFIWVIFVQDNREAMPATWHNLLNHITDEVERNAVPSGCMGGN